MRCWCRRDGVSSGLVVRSHHESRYLTLTKRPGVPLLWIGVVLAVAASALGLLMKEDPPNDHGSWLSARFVQDGNSPDGERARLTISVEGDGLSRESSVVCGVKSDVSGFLADEPNRHYAACVTALDEQGGQRLRRVGYRPASNCDSGHSPPPFGARARITGQIRGREVDRTLSCATGATKSWRYLAPLLRGAAKPLLPPDPRRK